MSDSSKDTNLFEASSAIQDERLKNAKETPHNYRLSPFSSAYLHIFRHIAQKLLDGRQPACVVFVQSDEKSVAQSNENNYAVLP